MDRPAQQRLLSINRGFIDEDFDFGRGLLNCFECYGRSHLAFVPLPQIDVSAENGARQKERAKHPDQQPLSVTLFFFVDRDRFSL